jgi:hypothetical protein
MLRGAPGYRSPLDRDDEGVACETDESSAGTISGSGGGSGGSGSQGSGSQDSGSEGSGSEGGGSGASAIAPPTRTVTPTTLAYPTSSAPSASRSS